MFMQGDINADGSGAEELAVWRTRCSAEAEIAAAQAAGRRGDEVRLRCRAMLTASTVSTENSTGEKMQQNRLDCSPHKCPAQGAAARLAAAEHRLDEALESALDLQMNDEFGSEEGASLAC